MKTTMQASDVSQEDVLHGVAAVLDHFISESSRLPHNKVKPTEFDQDDIQIGISDFLDHIAKSGLCSKECYIIALVYVERLLQKHTHFVITSKNIHWLMLVSIMLASKMLDDFYCRNMYYANAGGLTLELLNQLEIKMCTLMDFDLTISVNEFELYRDSLRQDFCDLKQTQQLPPGIVLLNFEPWSTGCGSNMAVPQPTFSHPQQHLHHQHQQQHQHHQQQQYQYDHHQTPTFVPGHQQTFHNVEAVQKFATSSQTFVSFSNTTNTVNIGPPVGNNEDIFGCKAGGWGLPSEQLPPPPPLYVQPLQHPQIQMANTIVHSRRPMHPHVLSHTRAAQGCAIGVNNPWQNAAMIRGAHPLFPPTSLVSYLYA
eukprot:m.30001 g.30001  ORF g.30001 m.30001 type:complete len:369 (-) comp16196_c1_seq1:248-1354(-)